MPTGYTAALEELNYDVKRWLKERIVRAFGYFGDLRDDGPMDEKSLLKHIMGRKKEESFYMKALREYREELTNAMNRTATQWQLLYDKTFRQAGKDYAERVEKHEKDKAGHILAVGKVASLYNKAVSTNQDELVVNSLKFALDQLNMVMSEYTRYPYKEKILDQSAKEWQRETIKELHEGIVRYSKYVEEEVAQKNPQSNGALAYKKLINFVDKNYE